MMVTRFWLCIKFGNLVALLANAISNITAFLEMQQYRWPNQLKLSWLFLNGVLRHKVGL